ncbi:MAG: hypothetical protein DRO00_02185 [Thermoproteota archaeon]|nr:MAG: hypothetical protein DRO00_02185 [Candidatus Korarchaeota archaeon]
MPEIDLAKRVIANLALYPREQILLVESNVNMVFRGGIRRYPRGPPEISTKLEGWTIKPNGALILTNRRIIFAAEGRKFLLLKVPEVLFEAPISMVYSASVAEGKVRELVISLETGIWRKDKFYFSVKDPDSWVRSINELISLNNKTKDSKEDTSEK